MFLSRPIGVLLCMSLMAAGCVPRLAAYPAASSERGLPPMYPERYEVAAKMNRLSSGVQELELKTRVTGCRQPNVPFYVIERIELYSPEGKLIHLLEKIPKPLGWGNYSGGFVIELPPSVPVGNYRFVAMLDMNGQICAKYGGGFVLRN